ncbi:MAG: hypothetical protein HGB17_06315, partial [Syntrophobacteraceae bacterium]|nr:hypothetical protein [Syntrophobacteraceae bacterium]
RVEVTVGKVSQTSLERASALLRKAQTLKTLLETAPQELAGDKQRSLEQELSEIELRLDDLLTNLPVSRE